MHVEMRPGTRLHPGSHVFEVRRAWQRRENREPRLEQLVALDERPQILEVRLAPFRVDHEVAGDAIRQRARNLHALSGVIDGRVLLQTVEPFVCRSLESEKDIEVLRDRAPGLQKLRIARDQIDTALYENPPFPDAAAAQLLREREAARRVVPEQIVGDEDVVPRLGEVPAH